MVRFIVCLLILMRPANTPSLQERKLALGEIEVGVTLLSLSCGDESAASSMSVGLADFC
jgi:hypothetical protein